MSISEMFVKYVQRKSVVSKEQLRTMALARQYNEVIEIYKKGQIRPKASAFDIIGYCYYQLTDYEEARIHLRNALKVWPQDYYSNFFLAVCLMNLGEKCEAQAQFLDCLKIHKGQAGEILDRLLPLATELAQDKHSPHKFDEVISEIEKLGLPNLHLAKILFYQRKDNEITPEVLKGSSFCRFYSAKCLTESGHGKFISLGVPEKLRVVRFENRSDVWVDTCPPYVAEISDAGIVSGSSLVFIGNGKVLSEVLADKNFGHFADMQYDKTVVARRNDALLVKAFEPNAEIPEGIMLCGLASNAYGHWFAEFLPKLRFFEKHPRFSQIPIIVDEGMPQSHYDFLGALVGNPTYRLPKGESLLVRNLLVAPADTFFPLELIKNHKVPPELQSGSTAGGLQYMGEKIRHRFGEPDRLTTRIFLSRRSSQWRRLLNEIEIISDLKELGFETVHIEDFSFDKQVRIFQEAEFIVAPNGSALNNLIFSNPRVKVLLLGQKHSFNWGIFFGSFMELGYSPQYLADDLSGDENEKHLDYTIRTSLIRTKVMEMLNS